MIYYTSFDNVNTKGVMNIYIQSDGKLQRKAINFNNFF